MTEFKTVKSLSRETALRQALGETDHVEVATERREAGTLAKREVEVARLVAEGLSNKQIGARLFNSDPTVATHLRNIMNKLGVNSRAQIASWITSSNC